MNGFPEVAKFQVAPCMGLPLGDDGPDLDPIGHCFFTDLPVVIKQVAYAILFKPGCLPLRPTPLPGEFEGCPVNIHFCQVVPDLLLPLGIGKAAEKHLVPCIHQCLHCPHICTRNGIEDFQSLVVIYGHPHVWPLFEDPLGLWFCHCAGAPMIPFVKGVALPDAMPSLLPLFVIPFVKGFLLPSAMCFYIPFVKGLLFLSHFGIIAGAGCPFTTGFFNFGLLWQSHPHAAAAAGGGAGAGAGAAFCPLLLGFLCSRWAKLLLARSCRLLCKELQTPLQAPFGKELQLQGQLQLQPLLLLWPRLWPSSFAFLLGKLFPLQLAYFCC